MSAQKQLKVKLVRSPHGRLPKQAATIRGLGLRRTGDTRVLEDTPAVRGMVNKIPHLVTILEGK
jgi:large subunit ribosomal protein L30